MRGNHATATVSVSPPDVAVSRQGWRKLSKALDAVRDALLGEGYEATVQDIAKAFGCSRRTAERIYAGQPVGAEQHVAAIFDPELSGPYVKAALETLPQENRARVALAIKTAAELVWLHERQEQLAQELDERKAG